VEERKEEGGGGKNLRCNTSTNTQWLTKSESVHVRGDGVQVFSHLESRGRASVFHDLETTEDISLSINEGLSLFDGNCFCDVILQIQ
jgi:hypothetical protein